jgi:hypothetical protein
MMAKRIIIEGRLVDQNANPIANQGLQIYVGQPTSLFGLERFNFIW